MKFAICILCFIVLYHVCILCVILWNKSCFSPIPIFTNIPFSSDHAFSCASMASISLSSSEVTFALDEASNFPWCAAGAFANCNANIG